MQLTVEKEAVEEMAEQIAKDLRRKYLPLCFYLHSVGRMLSTWLLFCRVSVPSARVVQGLWRLDESVG